MESAEIMRNALLAAAEKRIEANRRRYLASRGIVDDEHVARELENFTLWQDAYEQWCESEEEAARMADERKRCEERLSDLEARTPPRYKGALISDFAGTFVEPYIGRLLDDDAPSWICLGANGVGKTRLAYALRREWTIRGESEGMTDGVGLTSFFRCNSTAGTDLCAVIDSTYGWQKHLIIDEVDKLRGSENDIIFLTYLINRRYEYGLQTILFGNKGAYAKVEDIIGLSALSRLSGRGCLPPKMWNGDDRRKGNQGGK